MICICFSSKNHIQWWKKRSRTPGLIFTISSFAWWEPLASQQGLLSDGWKKLAEPSTSTTSGTRCGTKSKALVRQLSMSNLSKNHREYSSGEQSVTSSLSYLHLLEVPTIGLDHGLKSRSKGTADDDRKVIGHGSPFFLNGSLQNRPWSTPSISPHSLYHLLLIFLRNLPR